MLNPDLQLNPKIFLDDVEQVPIRKGFGEGLAQAGETNKQIVALCADLTESTQMHFFKEKFPERFVEIGVAEQNLATVASGMAAMGKYPFLSSYAMFSPGRNWEQIRTTIAYNTLKAVIVGSHAGVSVGPDGGTHQAIEDIALMRVMPRMSVISPCDAIQAKKAVLALSNDPRLAYVRLAREKTPVITTEATPFEFGKGQIFYRPEGLAHVAIVATGSLVANAIRAAKDLEKKGIKAVVANIHTIKPLDTALIHDLAKETKAIVSVEEHQIAGGLGSAVAEELAQNLPTPIEFVGVHDEFGQSGTPNELVEYYGMGRDGIVAAVMKVLERKH
ncbi:MAG TPA: transketolase C-terminal domain-containing protein [Candidatus Paceibacterota bacterium]|nr:transketolase C-terminal domain-containing protein [Candidatus Paceibacterota bacterium]